MALEYGGTLHEPRRFDHHSIPAGLCLVDAQGTGGMRGSGTAGSWCGTFVDAMRCDDPRWADGVAFDNAQCGFAIQEPTAERKMVRVHLC